MARRIESITAKTASWEYDILIGERFIARQENFKGILDSDKTAFVVSKRVYGLHREYIDSFVSMAKSGHLFLMDDGEENKNYRYAEEFLRGFIEKGLTRKSAVCAVGGGVVGDFAGFLASLYMRGIPIVHVPTTLLAMVDSSIGGKVAVNLQLGKNIVGAFHQPKQVLTDIYFLTTLPENEFRNGLAEIFKHGLIGEERTLEMLQSGSWGEIKNPAFISELIYRSALFKTGVVEKDEKESGLRAILNYGHTVGHAIESFMEYRGISHGEAVALGMLAESEISRRAGWLSEADMNMIREILDKYGLIQHQINPEMESIMRHMAYDKKNIGGKINFVLLKRPGQPVIDQQVDENLLREVLGSVFAGS